jgi:hypothetical protein
LAFGLLPVNLDRLSEINVDPERAPDNLQTRCCGQRTDNVLAFIDAEEDIPGLLPDIHKVECTFRENELDTALDNVAIVARDVGKKLHEAKIADMYPIESAPKIQRPKLTVMK